jgi:hypothetical protein
LGFTVAFNVAEWEPTGEAEPVATVGGPVVVKVSSLPLTVAAELLAIIRK